MKARGSKADTRRDVYFRLVSQVDAQLRDAFERRFRLGTETQATLAAKLGINRSVVHRRLAGRTNMRLDTLADVVWALGCSIEVTIVDAKGKTETTT